MARSWRQNVIVGHGGQHGVKTRSFRKGAPVTPEAARLIPNALLGQSMVEVLPPAAEVQARAVEKREERVKGPEKESPAAAQAAPVEPAIEPPVAELPDPTTKRELGLLRVSEVETLAARHGIVVEEGVTGRSKMLRDLLAAKLNL